MIMLILLFELSSKIVVPSSSLGHMLLVEIIIWVILPSFCTSAVHRVSRGLDLLGTKPTPFGHIDLSSLRILVSSQ